MIYTATPGTIGYIVQTIVAIAIAAIFIMSIVSFFLAIRDFIRSQGQEQGTRSGWNRIRFMMIGILLTVFFLFMLPLLVQYLGVDQYELFNAQNIFARIGDLMNQLFTIGTDFRSFS